MKNFLIYLLSFAIILSSIIFFYKKSNVSKENYIKISLGEVTHSVFYTPLYVAIENGYFKEENIDIDLVLLNGADKVSAGVLAGDVQIGLAGAESAIYVLNNNPKDYLQIFCGLTKRDGQFIISRNKNDDFELSDLYGKEILVGRSSGMPALNFLNALKKANIDKDKININYSIDFAALSGSFIGNTGDYVNLFEPNALKLEKEGYGYVVASIGLLSGEMPYTTFYAKKSYIKNNEDIIKGFVKAINKGIDFVKNNDEKTIATVIHNQFADEDINSLAIIIKRYKDNDSWLENNFVSEKLLENLEDIMIDNDLLDKYVDYKKLVINY